MEAAVLESPWHFSVSARKGGGGGGWSGTKLLKFLITPNAPPLSPFFPTSSISIISSLELFPVLCNNPLPITHPECWDWPNQVCYVIQKQVHTLYQYISVCINMYHYVSVSINIYQYILICK